MGILALPGREYVVDAGPNTLDVVLADGTVQVLAFFPNNSTSDATPTCVAMGQAGPLCPRAVHERQLRSEWSAAVRRRRDQDPVRHPCDARLSHRRYFVARLAEH